MTGLVAGVMSDGIEVLFANEVFESSSVFGTATSHCSCLVQPWEMVNMSALTGTAHADRIVSIRRQTAINPANMVVIRVPPHQISTSFGSTSEMNLLVCSTSVPAGK